MAFFGRKKEEKREEKKTAPVKKNSGSRTKPKKASVAKVAPKVKIAVPLTKGEHAWVLRAPRVTEKASAASERGVYVFVVSPRATKRDIGKAIEEVYGVRPIKINIARIPSKLVHSARRRQPGVKAGGKKAYVYLRKGEQITVV